MGQGFNKHAVLTKSRPSPFRTTDDGSTLHNSAVDTENHAWPSGPYTALFLGNYDTIVCEDYAGFLVSTIVSTNHMCVHVYIYIYAYVPIATSKRPNAPLVPTLHDPPP